MKHIGTLTAACLTATLGLMPTLGCGGVGDSGEDVDVAIGAMGDGHGGYDGHDGPGYAYKASPRNVEIARGYNMQLEVGGLDFPTALAFDDGRTWVSEAGYESTPKIKEILANGRTRDILSGFDLPRGQLLAPLTDVTYDHGFLWITHNQRGNNGMSVGAISKFQPENPRHSFVTVVTELPSTGDFKTNELVFDERGMAYFSQGTATNSAVVGPDNELITGWLSAAPRFHDFAPVDLVLNGLEFRTRNILTRNPRDIAITAPYMAYASGPIRQGTIVQAATPRDPQQFGVPIGGGAVYSFNSHAHKPFSTMKLEAWGMRDPYGLGLDPMSHGSLFVSNAGVEIRTLAQAQHGGYTDDDGHGYGDGWEYTDDNWHDGGQGYGQEYGGSGYEDGKGGHGGNPQALTLVGSRPIANDHDDMFLVNVARNDVQWFGFPDYFHDPSSGRVLPVTDPLFCRSTGVSIPCPQPVLASQHGNQAQHGNKKHQNQNVQAAFAQLENQVGSGKFDFSMGRGFGFRGDIFLAERGLYSPAMRGNALNGYKIVRVDRQGGRSVDFIAHRSNTQSEIFDPQGVNKPIDVKFRNNLMYVVDLGLYEPSLNIMRPGTGKVWIVANVTDGKPGKPGHGY